MFHQVFDNPIQHAGILGMKWGVRRYQNKDGSLTPAGKKHYAQQQSGSDDYQRTRMLRAKGTKNLSTKELQELTQRMNLEKQYNSLNPSDYAKGMDFTKKIIAAGTTAASLYALTKTPLGKAVISSIKNANRSKALDLAYRRAMGG